MTLFFFVYIYITYQGYFLINPFSLLDNFNDVKIFKYIKLLDNFNGL